MWPNERSSQCETCGCSVVSVENTKHCICTPLAEDNSLSSPGWEWGSLQLLSLRLISVVMSEWGPGEPRTHTLKGLSSRLEDLLCVQDVEWCSAVVCCYTAWGLSSTWVLIGSVRSQPSSSPLAANPLLPEGFSLHILPADYHHCQGWLLHSSCCPHSGSGANLTRLHGGRNFLTQTQRGRAAAQQSSSQALAYCTLQKLPSTTTADCYKKSRTANTACLSVRLSLVVLLNNIQSYKCWEQSPVLFTWK